MFYNQPMLDVYWVFDAHMAFTAVSEPIAKDCFI